MLVVEGLGKWFEGRCLFEDVSLRVDGGEAVAVVGPSGAGKTTLLRCIDGLDAADKGTVSIGGARLVAGERGHRLEAEVRAIRQRVGFVFQGCHLFSHRTVLENVMEGPVHVRRESPAVARERAVALLDTVGILPRAGAWPRQLSGGEQQRAAIARALAMQPELLLLDEPTSALDRARIDGLVTLLRQLMAGGLAILAVTHDLRFAESLTSRRFRLDSGRLAPA